MQNKATILLKILGLRLLCFLLSYIAPNNQLSAQNETVNWYFGHKAAVHFQSNGPIAILDSQMNSNGGSASISDSAGNLLFYTDGVQVWNRNHEVMQNGTNLGSITGYGYSIHPVIIIPKPGTCNLYYIFTVDGRTTNPNYTRVGLRYSIVDMSLDAGLGDITNDKNIQIAGASNAAGRLTAVRHGNNKDIWIISFIYEEGNYAAYLLSENGITPNPVLSKSLVTLGINLQNPGCIKVSSDGYQLFNYGDYPGVERCDFNFYTGIVSPHYLFATPGSSSANYSMEFSPNNKYLYLSNVSTVLQYDLTIQEKNAFISSGIAIGNFGPTLSGDYQLGNDGKIYIAQYTEAYLGVINYPNLPGISCGFQKNAIDLLGRNNNTTLPSFIPTYFTRFDFTGHCIGDDFSFTPNFNPTPDSIHWSFGDPLSGMADTSTLLSPSHTFTSAGKFTVTVFVRYPDGRTEETSREVTVAGLPQPNLGPDLTICKGTSVQLNPGNFTSYLWNTGSTSQTLNISDTGYYRVEVVNDTGCINRDTLHLSWFRQAVLDEGNLNIAPTTCNAATGAITGLAVDGLQPLSWEWKNGGGTILGHDPDLYHLPVDNYILSVTDSAGCTTLLKTYTIKNVGDSLILSVDKQASHCGLDNGSITVNATAGLTDMLFYAIDTNQFMANGGLFTGLPPGDYQVWVKDSLGCKKVYDGNPVQVFQLPGPSVQSIIQDEINGQSDGSILITSVLPSDSVWYTANGITQFNNGLFGGLSAGSYTCTVTDAWGCDTSFVLTIANIPSIRLQAIAGDGSACLGNVAVIPLLANHFSHVSAFSSRLKYNRNLVTCQNYLNANPVLSDSIRVDLFPTLGEIAMTWTGMAPVNLTDGSTLLELSFASLNTGQDSLKWDISPGICTFIDSLGNPIAPEFKQGQVQVYSIPQATINDPGPVCEGSDLLLLSQYQQGTGNGTISYQWTGPDGTTGSDPLFYLDKMQSSQAGNWTLTVSDTNHCQSSSSVEVNLIPLPVSGFPAGKDTLWFDEMTRLEALPGYASYRWNTGDSTNSIEVTSEGWYKVIMQTEEGCTSSDSVMMLYSFAPFTMPNAFTPDGDGINDVFRPVTVPEKVESFSMYIFDRWGRQIFATKDLGAGWDGALSQSKGAYAQRDKAAPVGVYTYIIRYSNSAGEVKKKTGMVTLVR